MPQGQPGRGFEEAWQGVRTAAADAGRDPSSLGLEGHIRVHSRDLPRVPELVARWRDAGAEAVALNPLRGGAEWPGGHLDALLRAADALR
jgi:hypothetical protein